MSISIKKFHTIENLQLSDLQTRASAYYQRPPDNYYILADTAAYRYNEIDQPFHCDLISRIPRGANVLEMGCGSAHLCPHVQAKGASYTGADFSQHQLKSNRQRYPDAEFFDLHDPLLIQRKFDIVVSLYTIEHVVNPISYLHELWDMSLPGGSLAIICPDFIDGQGFAPSIYFGKSPARIRQKITNKDFAGVIGHLADLLLRAPIWKIRARLSRPGAFWINLDPREFSNSRHSPDSDAIHLPRLKDILWWLDGMGAEIAASSSTFQIESKAVRNHNCYVFARKPNDQLIEKFGK